MSSKSAKTGATSQTKDSSFHGKNVPSSKPMVKNTPSNQNKSSKASNQRSTDRSSTTATKRDTKSLPANKQATRTRKESSSSKSTDSDSMSDSESDFSGSSSISSTSDSNSSHSSYTSSSNFAEKPGIDRNTFVPNTNTQSGEHPNSDIEISTLNVKDTKKPLTSSQQSKENKDTRKSSNSPLRSQARSRKEVRNNSKNLPPRTTKIHVGNLTRNILRSHLQEIFSNYGKIKSLDFPLDIISGFNQGYSYIDFYDPQSATDALNFMDEGYLDGQVISVQITHPLKRDSYRSLGRKSPKYSPHKRNWTPPNRRNVPDFRRGRSPIMRAPARFQRRKRDQSFSSSYSRSRSRSPSTSRHRSSVKKHYSKHTSYEKYRKYSRSISSQRYVSPPRKSRYRNNRHISTSSSYSTSSDSR